MRIGVLTDSEVTPAWAYSAFRMASEIRGVEFPVVVLNGDCVDQRMSFLKRILLRTRHFLSTLYLVVDHRFFNSEPDAFKNRSFKELFPNADRVVVKPIRTKFRDRFSSVDLDTIRSYNLDILFCRGFRILSGDILTIPKYGVWSFHHGDNLLNRGKPAVFYETFQSWEGIGTILQILKEELDNGTVIYKSISGHRSRFVSKNMNSVYWKSSFFIKRSIQILMLLGWEEFLKTRMKKYDKELSIYSRPLYTMPGNLTFSRLFILHYTRFLLSIISNFIWRDYWTIGFLRDSNVKNFSLHRFNFVRLPKDRFWADPIVVNYQNKSLIYFEEFIFKSGKGRISVIELPESGDIDFRNSKVVLELENHLSYPFVFKHEDQLYLVPECSSSGRVDLYRCNGQPHSFEFVKTLLNDIKAYDSTLFYKDHKWWIFANVVPHESVSSYEELCLFYSDDLLSGIWNSHPLNPIVSDVRSSRPAGPIFSLDGVYFRPSQICTPSYGYGIAINKIIKWTTDDYEEEVIEKILPEWSSDSKLVHSLSHNDSVIVVDAAFRKFRFGV